MTKTEDFVQNSHEMRKQPRCQDTWPVSRIVIGQHGVHGTLSDCLHANPIVLACVACMHGLLLHCVYESLRGVQ